MVVVVLWELGTRVAIRPLPIRLLHHLAYDPLATISIDLYEGLTPSPSFCRPSSPQIPCFEQSIDPQDQDSNSYSLTQYKSFLSVITMKLSFIVVALVLSVISVTTTTAHAQSLRASPRHLSEVAQEQEEAGLYQKESDKFGISSIANIGGDAATTVAGVGASVVGAVGGNINIRTTP